jgi:hypothetical protein
MGAGCLGRLKVGWCISDVGDLPRFDAGPLSDQEEPVGSGLGMLDQVTAP